LTGAQGGLADGGGRLEKGGPADGGGGRVWYILKAMCRFEDERTVMVCDVAIGHVRAAAGRAFGAAVGFTVVDGEGTRVEAGPGVDEGLFGGEVRTAIDAAQAAQAAEVVRGTGA
jgi:hypothetical protein